MRSFFLALSIIVSIGSGLPNKSKIDDIGHLRNTESFYRKINPDKDFVTFVLKKGDVKDDTQSGIEGETKPVNFYTTRDLKGEPFAVLDDKGLAIQGKVACTWNEYKYSEKTGWKMAVGNQQPKYFGAPNATIYCANSNMPFVNLIDIEEVPSQAIEVESRNEDIVEVRLGNKTVYVDLNEFLYKGYHLSKNKYVKEQKEKIELIKKEKEFVELLDGFKACLKNELKDCLEKYADKEFFYLADYNEYQCGGNDNYKKLNLSQALECLPKVKETFKTILSKCLSSNLDYPGTEIEKIKGNEAITLYNGVNACTFWRRDGSWRLRTFDDITPP